MESRIDELAPYQDDLDTDDSILDPITIEAQGENDDPVRLLGVPEAELKAELDKRAFGDAAVPRGDGEAHSDIYEGTEDDMREDIEDMDDNDKDNLPGTNA